MPKTKFQPTLDGIAFPYALSFSSPEFEAINTCFQRSIQPGLEYLKAEFGPFIDIYDLETEFSLWIEQDRNDISAVSGGVIFALLDYFFAHNLPPEELRNPQFLSQSSQSAERLRSYCWARTLDYLNQVAPSIMAWVAVRNLIPVDVFPENILDKQIRASVEKANDYRDVDIKYGYDIPRAGGYRWLYRQTHDEWEKIVAHIDNGKPCPVILMDRTTNLAAQHCVLAYAYEEYDEKIKKLYIYHPEDPANVHYLHIDFSGKKVGILTSYTQTASAALQGIICVRHTRDSPPFSLANRLRRYVMVSQLHWFLNHYL